MRKMTRLTVLWLFALLPLAFAQTQWPWPVTPFNQSHEITGNFSEYRSTSANGHFHNGTDIPKADGSPVYPVKDGMVTSLSRTGSNAFVRVNDHAYVHILPTAALSVGDSVFAQQTVLGTILTGLGHVHFISGFSGAERNSMLAGSGLNPYDDPWPPIIRFTNFYANNSDVTLSRTSLSGKVDIMVKVDEQNGPPTSSLSRRNNGTYEIGYKILNAAGDSVVYEPSINGIRFRFDTKPSNTYVNRVFYRPLSSTTSHVYQVTNNTNADFFWNTELLPYGNYVVMTFTRDTRSNTDTMYTSVTTMEPDLIPPDQPTLRSVTETTGGMLIRWYPNTDADLVGYRLYFSFDNVTWTLYRDEGQLTATATELEIPHIINRDVYYRITAVDNAPGIRNESLESDVYGMSNGSFNGKVLLVDGFDRTSGGWSAGQHDFAVRLGQSVINGGYSFDTVPNESVVDSTVLLSDYEAVFWMLGDESIVKETFGDAEQMIVGDYLENGGRLFVSGAMVAWDLDGSATGSAADREFLHQVLQCEYSSSATGNAIANGASGSLLAALTIDFGQNAYAPDSLNVLSPLNGAVPALTLAPGETIGVQYQGTVRSGSNSARLIYLALPLETVDEDSIHSEMISRVLDFFFGPTAIGDLPEDGAPLDFSLSANYPNPFNPETTMEFRVPQAAEVSLIVYNLLGQPIRVLVSGVRQPGLYTATWDGFDDSGAAVTSGIYLVRFYARAEGQQPVEQVRKMTLLR